MKNKITYFYLLTCLLLWTHQGFGQCIDGVSATPGACNADGTYDLQVCVTVGTPLSTTFDIQLNGSVIASPLYTDLDGAGCITIPSAGFGAAGENIPVAVVDQASSPSPLTIISILPVPVTDMDGDGMVGGCDESIVIENTSSAPIDVSGYTIDDGAGLRHVFPAGSSVPANGTLTLYSSDLNGTVFASNCSASSASGTWNNGGDSAMLLDPNGVLISSLAYSINPGDDVAVTQAAAVFCGAETTLNEPDCCELAITANASCEGVTEPGLYFVIVSNIIGGDGGPYDVTVNGVTIAFTPSVIEQLAPITFGPFTHSGMGGSTQTVVVTDASGCVASTEVLEILCGYPQNQAFCDCSLSDQAGPAGAIMAQAEPGTFTAGGNTGYTQVYVLTDAAGTILDYNLLGLFTGLDNGDYQVYAIIYENLDLNTVVPLLAPGMPISNFETGTGLEDVCFEVCGSAPYTVDCLLPTANDTMLMVCPIAPGSDFGQFTFVDGAGIDAIAATDPNGDGDGDDTDGDAGNLVTIHFSEPDAAAGLVTLPNVYTAVSGTVWTRLEDAQGCAAYGNITLMVKETPVVTAPDASICLGGTTDVTATVTGGDAAYTYNWTISGGTSTGATLTNADMATVTVDAAAATDGDIVLSLTAADANGCESDPIEVVVSVLPLPEIVPIADITICPGEDVADILLSSFPPDSSTIYTWSVEDLADAISLADGDSGTSSGPNPAIPGFTGNIPGTGNSPVATFTVSAALNGCDDAGDVTFTVTVEDNNGLVINCPGMIMVANDVDACGAKVEFPIPTAMDDCTEMPTVVITPNPITGITFAPGDFFPIGTTEVAFVATDANGNTDTCRVDIMVVDTQIPVVECPSNGIVADADANCQATVNADLISAIDNCPAVLTWYTVSPAGVNSDTLVGLAGDQVFELGETTVCYIISEDAMDLDGDGNVLSSECCFTVTVEDNTAPDLTCPADVVDIMCGTDVATAFPVAADLTEYLAQGGLATDNCTDDANIALISAVDSDSGLSDCTTTGLRTVTRTYTFVDEAGNTSTCDQLFVYAADTTAPSFTSFPADTDVECDEIPSVAEIDLDVVAADDCTGGVWITYLGETITDGTCPSTYTLTRSWSVKDQCNNELIQAQTINVADTELPSITCPADITVMCTPAEQPSYVNYTQFTQAGGTASDNCGLDEASFAFVDMVPGAATNIFIRTYQIADACGNVNTCTQNVLVMDTTPPVIDNCPATMVMDGNDPDECGAKVTWLEPTITDNCPDVQTVYEVTDETGAVLVLNNGDLFPVGTSTVTYTATDGAGLETVCSFDVMILDTQKPDVKTGKPQDVTVECDAVPAPLVLNPNDLWDNCTAPEDIVVQYDTTATNSGVDPSLCSFYEYTITRTWTVTDEAGNANICTQIIEVGDSTPPEFTAPSDITIECDADQDSGNTGGITEYSDNCADNEYITIVENVISTTQGADPAECDFYNYEVEREWILSDPCGNTAEAQVQSITVEDTTPPVPVCQDVTLELDENGEASITVDDIENGSTDNCAAFDNLTIEIDIDAFTCDNIGDNTVTLTVTDPCGNTASCEATVTVEDNTPPTITCPDDVTLHLGPGECAYEYSYEVIFDDNCTATLNQTDDSGLTSGSAFPIGTTTQSYQAEDQSGNLSEECSFTITVVEHESTILNLVCNNNINISLGADCQAVLHPDLILEGDNHGCYDDYVVMVMESEHPLADPLDLPVNEAGHPIIGIDQEGEVIVVKVIDPVTGITCWGYVTVEFKLVPEFACPADITITCNSATSPNVTGNPDVLTCGPLDVTYEDVFTDLGVCSSPRAQIVRTWTITNTASGQSSSCTQTISIDDFDVEDATFPEDYDNNDRPVLDCEAVANNPSLTDPSNTGWPEVNNDPYEQGGLCMVSVTYEDQIFTICPGSYEILRIWKVRDMCEDIELGFDPDTYEPGDNPILHTQVIKVIDSEGPEITCPDDLTISTNQFDCTGYLPLPAPSVEDNCSTASTYTVEASGGVLTQNGANNWIISELPEGGPYTVTYTVDDACGNLSVCTFDIYVLDDVPPIAICDEFTNVALGDDGTARVFANTFDDGSHDNCNDVYYKVRRMDIGGCNNLNGDDSNLEDYQEWFDDYADFCCDDIGDENIMVIFRVYEVDPGPGPVDESRHEVGGDLYGRYNECMVEAQVEDKLPPVIVCPPDITISCNYEFDPEDLAASFGTVVLDLNDREEVITNDPNGLGVQNWGFDGYATDNCSVTVTENSNENIDCGDGVITRVFTAVDGDGRTSSCIQRISIMNYEPLAETDIIWPVEEVTADCSVGIDPSTLGEPSISDDACDFVFVGYDEIELPVEAPYCVKILRTWVVVDWCQYVPNSGSNLGRWEFTQVIKTTDNTNPTLNVPADITFASEENNCVEAFVQIDPATGDDNCTSVTILNDAYYLNGADASGIYPYGTTTVTFTAFDQCGNEVEDEMTVTVVDGKAPTPVCQFIATTVMPASGEITIWASDFEADESSFDNCTAFEDLEFRIRKTTQIAPPNNSVPSSSSTNVSYGCNELGTQWVDLWVGDEAGNWDHCRTYVEIQDPTGACTDSALREIAGEVKTEMEDEVQDVIINLSGGSPMAPVVTGADGAYSFLVDENGNYTVVPEKDINPLNGVTTFDIVLMQKHILGVQPLGSPYKIIAADVNHSETVTTFDIVQLRKLILHIDTDFTENTSWRFVDRDFIFPDNTNPFMSSFPEVISFNSITVDELNTDFVGVKIGDVNDSVLPNELLGVEQRNTIGDLVFNIEDQQLKAGEEVTVEFNAKDFNNIVGYQFTLGFDQDALEFVDVQAGKLSQLDESNFGLALLDEGVITSSWNNAKASKVADNTTVFSLTFKALADGQLSKALNVNSKYTKAEAYTSDAALLDLALAFNNNGTTTIVGGAFELYQNRPNPFKEETVIGFNLPQATTATLTIYDIAGKVLKQYEGDFTKGYNELNITKSDLKGAGVVYYQLDTQTDSATRKMILIE